MRCCDRHLKLVHASKLADYVLDRRRVDVYTPDRHHVVAPAQQSAVEARESAPASARSQVQSHQISGPITDHRKSRAA